MLDYSDLPQWLEALLREKFFNACVIHEEAKKNEKNIFCLDCCHSICAHCLSPHRSHRLLQVRRYVYHDVLRLGDAGKLMDCAHVQPYTTNSAKVVFLNPRPQNRAIRGSGSACITCDRGLQDPFLFCSLYCKLKHILRTEGSLSGYIFDCEFLTLSEQGLDDGLMTPDSVLEPDGSFRTVSAASSGSGGAGGGMGCQTLVCTATTDIVRKKRSSISALRAACMPVCSTVSDVSAGLMNRRKKGAPHRSPLY